MITTFINFLATNKGYSRRTCESYEYCLHKFAGWARTQDANVRWSTITKTMIDRYVTNEVEAGAAASSIKQTIAALRTFYKTAWSLGYNGQNPARFVSTPKKSQKLPNTIKGEEIRAAIQHAKSGRTAAILSILYETGIRLQEMLDIKPADIDQDLRRIKIHGKGRKERYVYYGNLTAERLEELCTEGMEQRDVRRDVYEALKPYTQAEQKSPHAIRHTFATTALNNGMSIDTLSMLLGHASVKTTEIYAKTAGVRVAAEYDKFRPQ